MIFNDNFVLAKLLLFTIVTLKLQLLRGQLPQLLRLIPNANDLLGEVEFPTGKGTCSINNCKEEGECETEVEKNNVEGVERAHVDASENRNRMQSFDYYI